MQNRHFVGELVDENDSIRIVGFHDRVRRNLQQMFTNNTPVTITKCAIDTNKHTDTLQVIVKGNSSVTSSTQALDIRDPSTIGTTTITLMKLHEQDKHTKLNFVAKVIEVKPLTTVTTGKIKQDIVLADSTGDGILTLWEEHVGKLEQQKTYSFKKLDARVFLDERTLAILPHASTMIPANDIDTQILEPTTPNEHTLDNANIIAITDFQHNTICLACSGRVHLEADNTTVGKCQKCSTVQLIGKCKENKSATLTLETNYTTVMLGASGDVLQTIAAKTPFTEYDLLCATPFNVTYNKYNKIINISRD